MHSKDHFSISFFFFVPPGRAEPLKRSFLLTVSSLRYPTMPLQKGYFPKKSSGDLYLSLPPVLVPLCNLPSAPYPRPQRALSEPTLCCDMPCWPTEPRRHRQSSSWSSSSSVSSPIISIAARRLNVKDGGQKKKANLLVVWSLNPS